MNANEVKSRRYYRDARNGEVIYITGWQTMKVGFGETERDERWLRVRYPGDRTATMLTHPSNVSPLR